MIFIQSDLNDTSTNDVLDWCYYLSPGAEVKRFNDEIPVRKISIKIDRKNQLDSIDLASANDSVSSSDLSGHWYRRGETTFNKSFIKAAGKQPSEITHSFSDYIYSETNYVLSYLGEFFAHHKTGINKANDNLTNKISNLIKAKQQGLSVPATLITNCSNEVISFLQANKKVITKAIADSNFKISFTGINITVCQLPVLVDIDTYTGYQQRGAYQTSLPSLYQEYIDKKYELRIFYLKGKFYPMAIFSQASEKTKTDFRNYDRERPNRCVPYKLPDAIEQKLDAFMSTIDMNCGSIDMIYTPDGDYVFLEVNPVGQFQWLSKNCNYDIERTIAKHLTGEA